MTDTKPKCPSADCPYCCGDLCKSHNKAPCECDSIARHPGENSNLKMIMGMHMSGSNETFLELKTRGERMVDAADAVRGNATRRECLALACFMDRDSVMRIGQDQLMLIYQLLEKIDELADSDDLVIAQRDRIRDLERELEAALPKKP